MKQLIIEWMHPTFDENGNKESIIKMDLVRDYYRTADLEYYIIQCLNQFNIEGIDEYTIKVITKKGRETGEN